MCLCPGIRARTHDPSLVCVYVQAHTQDACLVCVLCVCRHAQDAGTHRIQKCVCVCSQTNTHTDAMFNGELSNSVEARESETAGHAHQLVKCKWSMVNGTTRHLTAPRYHTHTHTWGGERFVPTKQEQGVDGVGSCSPKGGGWGRELGVDGAKTSPPRLCSPNP